MELIIKDKTFALRLFNFVDNVEVQDLASEEEKSYLLKSARQLLVDQVESSESQEELEYIKNNEGAITQILISGT